MKVDYIKQYHSHVVNNLDSIVNKERAKIENAADIITERFVNSKLLHVLGSGHSMCISQEMFQRAGGLMPVNAILDPGISPLFSRKALAVERLSEYARILIDHYEVEEDDVFFVVSLSGVNAVPVEAAVEAKSIGAYVMGLTSIAASGMLQPRNKYGKRLYEVADLTIDNHVAYGDAAIRMGDKTVGPMSTVVNAFIVNLIAVRVAENYLKRGLRPPIWASTNVPGGDEMDAPYVEKYKHSRIRHL